MDSSQNFYPSPEDTAHEIGGGPHTEGRRMGKGRFSEILVGTFDYIRKRLPTPGIYNYAFSSLQLYEQSPIGPAAAARKNWYITQPPQLYLNGQAVTTIGIGGLAAGQYISQPLLDPNTLTYGGEYIGE
jgi:hypothetical protein